MNTAITVGELKKAIANLDDDLEVILADDISEELCVMLEVTESGVVLHSYYDEAEWEEEEDWEEAVEGA